MEQHVGTISTLMAIFIFLTSYKGFQDSEFLDEYIFDVDGILIDKDYKRLISSGFLHGGWWHLIFNMFALISFGETVEMLFGLTNFLLLYFLSLVGGNLFALYIHRNHGDYRALGASGAISGVIFAAVVLMPTSKMGFMFIPVDFPMWLFGIIFVIASIFGIKGQVGNIGHEAHLGGAIVGILFTILLYPEVLQNNLWIVAALLIPSILFLTLLVRNPEIMLIDNYWGSEIAKAKDWWARRNEAQEDYVDPQEEVDRILMKIRKSGMESLTRQERATLDEFSKRS